MVGYGMGVMPVVNPVDPHGIDYFSKYISGWNVKKSTPLFSAMISAKEGNIWQYSFKYGADGYVGRHSDSGSPIVYEENGEYILTAVNTGVNECLVDDYIVDWIMAVGEDALNRQN